MAAELIQGSPNRKEQQKVWDLLSRYALVWPRADTCNRALRVFSEFYLSHGLGLIDALLGQSAVDMDVPLYTFNVRHYGCIPGLRLVKPYERKWVGIPEASRCHPEAVHRANTTTKTDMRVELSHVRAAMIGRVNPVF